MDTIGKRLMEARKQLNLTIIEVSRKTGVAKSNLSRIENDKHDPSAGTIVALSQLYGVSTDWILLGDNRQEQLGQGINFWKDKDDEELVKFFNLLNELWVNGDQNLRGWIIVQLRRAFPELAERVGEK